jgi:hypothetical protein
MSKMVRQGDVLFVPIERLPEGIKLEQTKTVAYGEQTGHHHTLVEVDGKARVFSLENNLFTKVEGDVVITHQEHQELPIAPGLYEIRIQQEYTPEEVRRVLD